MEGDHSIFTKGDTPKLTVMDVSDTPVIEAPTAAPTQASTTTPGMSDYSLLLAVRFLRVV